MVASKFGEKYSAQNNCNLQVRTFFQKSNTCTQKRYVLKVFYACAYVFFRREKSLLDRQGQPAPFSKLHSRTLAKVLSSGQTDLLEAMRCTRRTIIYKKESVARASNYKAYHVRPEYENSVGPWQLQMWQERGGAQLQHWQIKIKVALNECHAAASEFETRRTL